MSLLQLKIIIDLIEKLRKGMGNTLREVKCTLFGLAITELVLVTVGFILNIIAADILASICSAIAIISAILCIAGSNNFKAPVLMAGAILGFIIAALYLVALILVVAVAASFGVNAGLIIVIVVIEGIVIVFLILTGVFALKLKNLAHLEFNPRP